MVNFPVLVEVTRSCASSSTPSPKLMSARCAGYGLKLRVIVPSGLLSAR